MPGMLAPIVTNNQINEYLWLKCDNSDAGNRALDSSLNGYSMKFYSGTASTYSAAGLIGNCFAFSGSAGSLIKIANGYATHGEINYSFFTNLTAAGKDFSIAFWMRPHYVNAIQFPFGCKGSGTTEKLTCQTYGGSNVNLTAYCKPPSGTMLLFQADKSGSVNWDNIWFHFVVTRSGTTWRTYSNGLQYATETAVGNDVSWYTYVGWADAFVLGASNTTGYPAKVDIDDFRMYSRCLNTDEIDFLYNAGAGSAYPLPLGYKKPEHMWLQCDDTGATATVIDSGTAANNLSFNSGTCASYTTATAKTNSAAFAFDGTVNTYLDLASGSGNANAAYLTNLTAASQNFTIAFWIRCTGRVGNDIFVRCKGNNGTTLFDIESISTNGANLTFTVTPSGGTQIGIGADIAGQGTWSNTWYHIAVTRIGKTWHTYRNGALSNTQSPATGDAAWYTSVGATDYFRFMAQTNAQLIIDDFRTYNRGLSTAEIVLLYNGGSGRTTGLPTS